MHEKLTSVTALGLLVSAVFACSVLRPKRALNWHITLELDRAAPDRDVATNQAVEVLERRLDALGVHNFEVRPQGKGRILVSLSDVRDPERLKRILTAGGKLELVHVISPPSPAPSQTYATREEAIASLNSSGIIPANRRVLPYTERAESVAQEANSNPLKTNKWVVVESPAIIDGSELRTASAVQAYRGSDEYEIQFSLTKSGADKFGAWTGANINEYVGVVLNDEVKSTAYLKSQIFDQGEITGRFTKQSAEDLALILKSGALPASVKIVEESKN